MSAPMTLNPFFMFATGIENSIPTIDGGRKRVDEMEKCRFYENWRTDFDLVREIGTRFLRYGPPLHKTFLGPDRFDWSFSDETFARIFELGIVPIVDLCHFGVPDWIGDYQNPDFPKLFASYARAFAERFPWVQLYTPANEMFICATFSGLYGWWNEQGTTDRTFVTALKHLVQANLLAMGAILEVRPDAILPISNQSLVRSADRTNVAIKIKKPDRVDTTIILAKGSVPIDLVGQRVPSEPQYRDAIIPDAKNIRPLLPQPFHCFAA